MISCKPWKDGFELAYNDSCLFRHSSKAPGLYLSRKPPHATLDQHKELPLFWKAVGACTRCASETDQVVSFSDGLTLKLELSERYVRLRFSGLPDSGKALRLRIEATPGERFFGLGPAVKLLLDRGKTYRLAAEAKGGGWRASRIFSSRSRWICCGDSSIATAWSFKQNCIDLRFSGIPKDLILGSDGSPLDAMESLSAYVRLERAKQHGSFSDIADLAVNSPILLLSGSGLDYGELLCLAEKTGSTIGLIAEDRVVEPIESDIIAFCLSRKSWDSFLSDSDYRPVETAVGAGWDAGEITSLALSVSLSGGFNPFIPALWSDSSPEASEGFWNCLGIAPFGSLFVVAPPRGQEAPRRFKEQLFTAMKIFAMMKPYREYCTRQWKEKALPALRHPAFILGTESSSSGSSLWEIRDEYLFGTDILVAPPSKRRGRQNKGNRSLVLPPGEWIHLWTSRRYPSGRTVLEDSPGRPAVFYRRESEFARLFDDIRKSASRLA